MPLPSEIYLPRQKTAGYWWLVAILLPIGAFVLGIIIGHETPLQQSDWLGMGFVVPVFITLACGCVAAVLAAIVSFWSREERAYLSLFPAIPSLVFVCWIVVAFAQAGEDRKRREISNAQYQKQQEAELAQTSHWIVELRAHPELITSDDFWKENRGASRSAEWGLIWLLRDKAFVVTPEIRAYVIKNFPQGIYALFQSGRFTLEELQATATDPKADYHLREQAVDTLLRTASFDAPSEFKTMVLGVFPNKAGLLFGGRKFTKTDLEELVRNPKTPEWVKRDAQRNLKSGYFKQ